MVIPLMELVASQAIFGNGLLRVMKLRMLIVFSVEVLGIMVEDTAAVCIVIGLFLIIFLIMLGFV